MNAGVLISIVSWNSERDLARCLESVLGQTVPCRILVFDNASQDRSCALAASYGAEVRRSERNLGFSRGHNQNLLKGGFDFALLLNPDVVLDPRYLEALLEQMKRFPEAGLAGGKLYRMGENGRPVWRQGRAVLDSTGIHFTPAQRHFDRGSENLDRGQYDRVEFVFGISGAALLCRRRMLEDIRIEEEYLDEDFFAYREDADLAWRAALYGWSALYVPEAVAWHRRSVTPERRRRLPPEVNYHSVKNRYLMRSKNMDWAVRLRCFPFMWLRDFAILLYAMVLERSSLPALSEAWKLRRRMRAKRRRIQQSRRVSPWQMARWFAFKPVARPAKTAPVGPPQ